MDSAPEFLNLFVDPTGELLYFLAVIAISQAALLMALGQRLRGAAEVAAGRYTVLLAGIVLAWIALMGGALYTLATDTTADAILPPLERAVNLVVIILASAALLAADSEQPVRRSWRATALLCLLAIGAYIYTAATWQPLAAGEDFNEHILGFVWTFVTGLVLISAIGLLLIRYRDTADIPLKLLFFVVLLAGYTYTLILMTRQELDGGASGAIRLSFLASLPMIATVVYRLVLDRLEAAIDEVSEYAEAVSRPLPSQRIPEPAPARPAGASYVTASESMALLKAMGLMLEKEDPESIPRQIAVAVAQVLKADVAVLIAHEDANWADITAAYDHVQGRQVPGLALNLDEQPTLVNALERKSQRPLFPDRNLDELVDLYTRLDISQVGPAYMQPLTRSGQVVGALIVAMPYTGRELDESQTSLLEGLGPIAARLLLLSQAAQRTRFEAEDRAIQAMVEGASTEVDPQAAIAARQEMQESLRLAQQQIGELSHLVRDLQVELDFERSRLAQLVEGGDEALSITQRIESLSQERKQLASEREALVQALHEAQAALATATAEGDEDIFGTMIDTLKRERDELQVQKAKLERQLDEVRAGRETITVPVALREMVTELSEDKARLAVERDQLQVQLEDVQTQLQALGIEGGPLAVAQILGQLTEERTYYKTRAEKIAQERDLLLSERTRLTEQIQREAEREAKIGALEADLRRLATDREALMKQRDSIRAERDDLLKAREAWLDQRTRLLAEVTGLQAELEEAASELNDLVTERKRISQERGALEAQRDRLLAEKTALQTERDQLMARVEGNRELLEQLGADGFGALKVMIDDLTEERQQLEAQLLQTQAQMAELERQATSRVAAASTQATRPIAPENADVILSVAQELRTPMSSIIGYTDLLLNESVGILGALQRQFLQRVQANISRLDNLIQDLVSVTALDTEHVRLQPVRVDLLEVVEDAITTAGPQFREKGITLHMNLAEQLPPLRADRDAMHQAITQLLSNAYLASPPDSEVTITVQHEPHFTPPFSRDTAAAAGPIEAVYVAVTDQGGGVPPDEQRRVFARRYRADNPLIEGLGDTGVGLSIAKTLVEAHRGGIWMESQPGQGTTFQFYIPLASQPAFLQEA